MYNNQPFLEPNNRFGFVYLVTCSHPEFKKKYIGRKFFYTNFGKKTKQKQSDWTTYKTSSKNIAEAIEKHGVQHFHFEILQLYHTRAGVVAGEVEVQWEAKVLYAKDKEGEREYINNAIGNIKFISKEHSDEAREKISKSQMGRLNHQFKGIIEATCIATGSTFRLCGMDQMVAAGLDFSRVYRCANGEAKSHKGYVFSRLKNE